MGQSQRAGDRRIAPRSRQITLTPKPFGDDPLEVDLTPAHDAVFLPIPAGADDLRQLSRLLRRKAKLGTLRPAVDDAFRRRRSKQWTQSRKVWRSMPRSSLRPRSIPSRTTVSDRRRQLSRPPKTPHCASTGSLWPPKPRRAHVRQAQGLPRIATRYDKPARNLLSRRPPNRRHDPVDLIQCTP